MKHASGMLVLTISEKNTQPLMRARKVPNEDIRPWGRQLYAFLGILFVPILIDSFWSAVFSHHRYQLKHDDTRTHSTYREWVSKPRNMLCSPSRSPLSFTSPRVRKC